MGNALLILFGLGLGLFALFSGIRGLIRGYIEYHHHGHKIRFERDSGWYWGLCTALLGAGLLLPGIVVRELIAAFTSGG